MKDNDYVVPPVLYRADAAAQALRLSRSALYELIRSGRLRTIKEGRRRLVPVEALSEYVAAFSGDAAGRGRAVALVVRAGCRGTTSGSAGSPPGRSGTMLAASGACVVRPEPARRPRCA